MRNRHIPRLCRNCARPMASQEDACWSCGTPWVTAAPTRIVPIIVESPAVELDIVVAAAVPVAGR